MPLKIKELKQDFIPPITDPMGSGWQQPKRSEIEIDGKFAYMLQSAFDKLLEYSTSQPSGVYPGKMWKGEEIVWKDGRQHRTGKFFLRWYGLHEDPKLCSNNSREILIA